MRFEGLDLNLLIALDAILEERSVMAASRRLHLSQPAMSAAVGRLRQYFNDDIFTISQRKLVPTPLAQSLEKPTRDILLRIRANLISPPKFDPASSERRFRLVVSDYASIVLMHAVMKRVYRAAPRRLPGNSAVQRPGRRTASARRGRFRRDSRQRPDCRPSEPAAVLGRILLRRLERKPPDRTFDLAQSLSAARAHHGPARADPRRGL